MVIAIASDHAGVELKTLLIQHLHDLGMLVIDYGTHDEESVDYPDYAHTVASKVNDSTRGILLCGSGNGICMAANKHPGIRAAVCWEDRLAALARSHNDANVLCIPARFVSQKTAREIVDAFLTTQFSGDRHQKRVEKIDIKVDI